MHPQPGVARGVSGGVAVLRTREYRTDQAKLGWNGRGTETDEAPTESHYTPFPTR